MNVRTLWQPITIDSVDDPRLSDYRDLKGRPSGRGESSDHFIVEGPLAIKRLLTTGIPVRSILIELGRPAESLGPPRADVPLFAVSDEIIRGVAGFDFHRGFLASASRQPFSSVEAFRGDRLSLGLVNVSDMQNLGSMLRSASAFGIRQVLLDHRTVDPYSRRSVRVSMGASLGMDYRLLDDPGGQLGTLAQSGIRTLAATLAADAVPVDRLQLDDRPTVLLLGNEGNGLPADVQLAATDRIIIPMGGKHSRDAMVDSLNVSVAAAILMFQLAERSG